MLGARQLEALASELSLNPGAVARTDVTRPEEVKALADQAVRLHRARTPSRIGQPDDVDINEILFRPTSQLF